jgi:hypothetical protein
LSENGSRPAAIFKFVLHGAFEISWALIAEGKDTIWVIGVGVRSIDAASISTNLLVE